AGQRVVKKKVDAAFVLRKSAAAPAQVQAIRADALTECIEQHLVQVAAVDRELRPFISGMTAGRLAVDELAEAVVEARFARRDRDCGERRLEPEPAQLARGVRQQVY